MAIAVAEQAQLQVELADADRRSKKSELIPDVSLAFTYTSFVNVSLLPQNVGLFGFQVDWEPFDWGRRSKELAATTRAVDQAKHNLTEARNRILVEVAGAYRNLEQSRALVAENRVRMDVAVRFRDLQEARALLAVRALARESATEKMRVALNRYREQSALFKDVLEVQASQADSSAQYQQALMSLWTARAELEKSIGGED